MYSRQFVPMRMAAICRFTMIGDTRRRRREGGEKRRRRVRGGRRQGRRGGRRRGEKRRGKREMSAVGAFLHLKFMHHTLINQMPR